tara:strand:- start:1629 stop:1802 length:174 start_codon:yes stop_codon:yes gene_type:complete
MYLGIGTGKSEHMDLMVLSDCDSAIAMLVKALGWEQEILAEYGKDMASHATALLDCS